MSIGQFIRVGQVPINKIRFKVSKSNLLMKDSYTCIRLLAPLGTKTRAFKGVWHLPLKRQSRLQQTTNFATFFLIFKKKYDIS